MSAPNSLPSPRLSGSPTQLGGASLPPVIPGLGAVLATDDAQSTLEQELVKKLGTGRAALPVLPHVATLALRLAGNPDAKVGELAALIDGDPPIAARFLSVANSVIYFRGWRTSSTHSAIVRLGLSHTRDILFQVVYSASMSGIKRFHEPVRLSFERSVACALAARAATRAVRVELDSAYMCGLLHDIGEARIYRIFEELKPPLDADAEIIRLVHKYHCFAGAEIATTWQLPSEIVDACALHHEHEPAGAHVRIVRIADVLVDALDAALDFDRCTDLGLDTTVARNLLSELRAEVSKDRASA
jgi:putative nucleotidyltransferase with HDIG domain